jgi:hypothetical protein
MEVAARLQHDARIAYIPQDRQAAQTGDNFPQKFEALGSGIGQLI